jgi:hypothetical protein
LHVPDDRRHGWRNSLNYNITGNVQHDVHMIIIIIITSLGHPGGENMANSSSGSLQATRVPGCIGMDLRKFFVGTHS